MKNQYEIVVIGGGFSGLSCSAHLRKRGVDDLVIIEKGQGVGGFWRGNYDRIRLHTPFHELPDDGGIRRNYPQFLPRDDLIDYFEKYADRHRLNEFVCPNSEVTSIVREGERWRIETGSEVVFSN
jgi:cation diffusion facilitator CzcD-associated flavoprotein CzcO